MIQIEQEEAFLLSSIVFALERRLPEAGKTFDIFELLRTWIKKSIVAMLSPTILFSCGERSARRRRTCAHSRPPAPCQPARYLRSPSS